MNFLCIKEGLINRQKMLAFFLIIFAVFNLSQKIIIIPGCQWSHYQSSGVLNDRTQVSVTRCLQLPQSPGWPGYPWTSQNGFYVNTELSPDCIAHKCGIHQCLIATTPPGGSTSHKCEASATTGDIQPFVAFINVVFLVWGVVLAVMRPSSYSNQKLIGAVLVILSANAICDGIRIYSSCAFQEATNTVSYQRCGVPALSTFATNRPWNGFAQTACSNNGCTSGQCLETSTSNGVSSYHCHDQSTAADMQPWQLFTFTPLLIAGLALMYVPMIKLNFTWTRMVGLGMLVFALYSLAYNIYFINGCNYDELNSCQSGSEDVSLTPCQTTSSLNDLVFSPFLSHAVTALPHICIEQNCGFRQCVKTTSGCNPGATTTSTCVAARGISWVSPVVLWTDFVFLGIAAWLIFRSNPENIDEHGCCVPQVTFPWEHPDYVHTDPLTGRPADDSIGGSAVGYQEAPMGSEGGEPKI